MNTDLFSIVKEIVAKSYNGDTVLSDPGQLNAFFKDLAQDIGNVDKKILLTAVGRNFYQILKDASKNDAASIKIKLTERLYKEEGFDNKLSRDALELLAMVAFARKVREYVSKAKECMKTKDFDSAISVFTEAINFNQTHGGAFAGRGEAYYNKGMYDEAKKDASEAIKLQPDNTTARDLLNKTNAEKGKQWFTQGKTSVEKGDFNSAIKKFTKAVESNPNDGAAYEERGEIFLMKRMYDEAIRDFSEAIKIDPKSAFAYYKRGNAFSKKQYYDRAIDDYTQAINIRQDDERFYYNRGNKYLKKTDYDSAIDDYKKAIEIKPDYTKAHNNLSIALERLDH